MIENRPWLTVLSHAMLIAGIAVIAFPLYITFVASTHTLDEIIQVPMPLVPGDQFWENYSQVLASGTGLMLWLSSGFGTAAQQDQRPTLRVKSQSGERVVVGEFEVK